jgi:probable F420-dependent oxidoreductase
MSDRANASQHRDSGRGAGTTRPVRVGIQLPEVEREVRWPEYAAMARAAEEVGFDSIWVGDHYLYRADGRTERGPWEAWTLLAALAGITERVALGPLVACLGFHTPGILAKMAATVDEIGGGRLVLGVGAGWNATEFRAFGVSFDRRVARFEESFEVVRRLLGGERVTFHGRFVDLDDAVLLPTPLRRPTLMLGSSGDRMLSIALPYVDAWNTWYEEYGNTPDGYAAMHARVSAACERAGRDPVDVLRSVCSLVVLDPGACERTVPEGVHRVTGSPTDVAEHVRALADAGADEVILVVDPITEPSIRTLGDALTVLDA